MVAMVVGDAYSEWIVSSGWRDEVVNVIWDVIGAVGTDQAGLVFGPDVLAYFVEQVDDGEGLVRGPVVGEGEGFHRVMGVHESSV